MCLRQLTVIAVRSTRRSGRIAAIAASIVAIAVVVGSVPDGRVGAACWLPPVDAVVSDPYRAPACPWCAGNRGIEYATVPGMPVRAVAAGRVTFAGTVVDRRYVVVEHGDGRRATYGNLSSLAVRRGDRVVTRSVIGTTTATMHFGLRDGDRYIDPTSELGRPAYRVRLVPTDGSPGADPGPARARCDRDEKAPAVRANPIWRR